MTTRHSRRRTLALVAGVGSAAMLLAGCAGGGGGSTSSPKEFSLLTNSENAELPAIFTALSEDECATENTALPFTSASVPQTNLDQ